METYKTTIQGFKVDIIYFANTYYFVSFKGLISIANICSDRTYIEYGNEKHSGEKLTSDRILTGVKRFLNRTESRFNDSNLIANYKDLQHVQLVVTTKDF